MHQILDSEIWMRVPLTALKINLALKSQIETQQTLQLIFEFHSFMK
jgi:hypothetical protein